MLARYCCGPVIAPIRRCPSDSRCSVAARAPEAFAAETAAFPDVSHSASTVAISPDGSRAYVGVVTFNFSGGNFSAAEVNQTIASAGVRDELPAFMRLRGQTVTLKGGTSGHEGWFGLTALPANWVSAAGANDAAGRAIAAASSSSVVKPSCFANSGSSAGMVAAVP